MNFSKRELNCSVDSVHDFLKAFDHASKCLQVPLLKPKVEIGSTRSKDNLFAHYYNDIIEHPNRQIRLSFRFGILVFFPSKSLSYTAINLLLQKLLTLTIVNFTISTKTDITLQTSVKLSRAITMCCAFTPDCGYNNSNIILIGDVYCPNTKCSGRLCNLSAEPIINVRNARLCVRCAVFLLKIKQIPFSCRLAKGFRIFKGAQNQFKMLLEMSIFLASIVPT